jgi:hypothetical protein
MGEHFKSDHAWDNDVAEQKDHNVRREVLRGSGLPVLATSDAAIHRLKESPEEAGAPASRALALYAPPTSLSTIVSISLTLVYGSQRNASSLTEGSDWIEVLDKEPHKDSSGCVIRSKAFPSGIWVQDP